MESIWSSTKQPRWVQRERILNDSTVRDSMRLDRKNRRNQITGVLFWDLSAAFDTLSNTLLIQESEYLFVWIWLFQSKPNKLIVLICHYSTLQALKLGQCCSLTIILGLFKLRPGLSFSKMFCSAKLIEIALSKVGSFAVRRLPTFDRAISMSLAERNIFMKLSLGYHHNSSSLCIYWWHQK